MTEGQFIISAWNKFQDSNESRSAFDVTTLRPESRYSVYLANRLNRAFHAGFEAGKQYALEKSTDNFRRFISQL